MKKAQWIVGLLLMAGQADAQILSRMDWSEPTARSEFKSVYETNMYFNDREEAIELKYADLKVPIFEIMEGPQDSLWMIEEKMEELRARVKREEYDFINWEKSSDRQHPNYSREREARQLSTCEKILILRQQIDALERGKGVHIRIIQQQEEKLLFLERSMEKELERNKQERQAALVKMFRA